MRDIPRQDVFSTRMGRSEIRGFISGSWEVPQDPETQGSPFVFAFRTNEAMTMPVPVAVSRRLRANTTMARDSYLASDDRDKPAPPPLPDRLPWVTCKLRDEWHQVSHPL